jgi:hypothetical protein
MSCGYAAYHFAKYGEPLMADDNCQETLQVLSLRYIPLKLNELYHFHTLHKACIVRNPYTIESTEKLYKAIRN